MRYFKVVLALAVGLMTFLGFWFFVGFSDAIDDFTDNSDDTDGDGEQDDYTAYAVFVLKGEIVSSVDSITHLIPMNGQITSVSFEVKDYVSLDEGRIFESDTLRGGGGGGQLCGEYWFYIVIRGPDGYVAGWNSTHEPVLMHTDADPQIVEITSGRCFFPVKGAYTATVHLWVNDYWLEAMPGLQIYLLDEDVKSVAVNL